MPSLPHKFYKKCRREGVGPALRSGLRFLHRRSGLEYAPLYLRSRILYIYYRITQGASIAKPCKIIKANPQSIDWLRVPHFNVSYFGYGSHILGGEWDLQCSEKRVGYFRREEPEKLVRFENYLFYRSVEQWLDEERDWNQTWCYRVLVRRKDAAFARSKGEKLSALKNSIESNGYLPQRDIQTDTSWTNLVFWTPPPEHDEIVVNIGRDGELIFDDGKHRFCILKVLGFDEVPVRVLVRHKEWQKIRKEIVETRSKAELSERARNHLGHPDLADVTPEAWL